MFYKKCLLWYEKGEEPSYCKKHAEPGMVDVVHKKCVKCEKRPSFGIEGGSATHCAEHAEPGMENVVSNRCIKCKTIASFGIEYGRPTHCKEHAEPGMEDVRSKKCEEIGCKTQALFGIIGGTPIYCAKHAEPGMEDIRSKKCEEIGCKTQASFGIKGGRATHCAKHANPTMEDLKSKKCESNSEFLCPITGNPKYNGYCFRCFVYLFPDVEITRNYKTKEKLVSDYIEEQIKLKFSHLKIIRDKIIIGGCSKRRPDIYIDCGTHIIIIEIDENQHRNTSCENLRMCQLYQDSGYINCVFIRFNPDSYVDKNGNKISSCFTTNNQTGLLYVKNKEDWGNRLNKLWDSIKILIETIPEKSMEIIELFYNEIDE